MTKHILVTGGAGYIGSHTCKALAARGYTPVTLDNLVYGHEWAVQWGPFVRGDIADRPMLDEVFRKYAPEGVIHFAAYTYVGESVADPGRYYRNNVAGALTLLEAMRDHGCGKMVFSSTCATYGLPKRMPMPESHPQWPVNPYGWSKFMIERVMEDFAAAHGLRPAALRYFNAAGADPDGKVGEEHDPETHLIPLVLHAAKDPSKPVTVFGDDYDTPDGTCIRDYIHVADLAEAHILTLDYLDAHPRAAFNLGTGRGNSVREIIEAAEEVTGLPITPKMGARRAGDPPQLVADTTYSAAELGWKPKYTDIRETLTHAWNWMRR